MSVDPEAEDFRPGDTFAGFRVLREIGRGGMGSVYLAEDERLRRRVALKVILPELGRQEGFRRRFEAEARAAAAIEHPNVVAILSAGAAEGRLYLAMRYVEGENLNEALEGGTRLEPAEAVRIIAAVAAGLDAAHAAGLVHRDVKPANVLLSGELGRDGVYLTDFGLVRNLDSEETRLTRTDQVMATLDYAAPEQLEGERVDARTDVYALGCVLYRILSGKRPFSGADREKVAKILGRPVPHLGGAEATFDPVIARATAKAARDRYHSAGDLAAAATAALEGRGEPTDERTVATGAAADGFREGHDRGRATEPLGSDVFVAREEPPTRPTGARSSGRGRRVAIAVCTLAILAGVGVAIAIAAGGSGDGTTETVVRQTTVTSESEAEAGGAAQEPKETQAKAPVAVSRAEPELRQVQSLIYKAKVPVEWAQDFEIEGENEAPYYPLQFDGTGEAGEPYVRLEGQYPAAVADPVEGEEGPRRTTSESSDYREISFGPIVIGGRRLVRWNYEVEGDRRVVYGLTECAGGMALVGSASPGHFAEFAPLFEEIAASLRFQCQD
jgi:hypothetical protein